MVNGTCSVGFVKSVCLSVCLSVCRPHVISAASIRRISVNFDIGGFMKICRETVTTVKIGLKCRAFCLKTYVCFIVASDINMP